MEISSSGVTQNPTPPSEWKPSWESQFSPLKAGLSRFRVPCHDLGRRVKGRWQSSNPGCFYSVGLGWYAWKMPIAKEFSVILNNGCVGSVLGSHCSGSRAPEKASHFLCGCLTKQLSFLTDSTCLCSPRNQGGPRAAHE